MATTRVNVEAIGSYFESLSDPRHVRNRKHLLVDVVVIAVCGLVCGCDGPTAIHRWAANRRDWLDEFLTLPNGVPSRDCIRRVLIALQPEAFQRCFQEWIADALAPDGGGPGRLVAIDGKTLRRSHDAANGLGPLHVVSAWASEHGVALGQVATEEKSNEITAIPVLLKQIELARAVVTIDAMGCQKDVARDVVAGGGDFVIAVKDNQPKLAEAIGSVVEKHLDGELEARKRRRHETDERGHGRRDERFYFVAQVPPDFAARAEWPWVKAVGTAVRVTTHADGTQSDEVRYYMLSRFLSGKRFGAAVRAHWGIESMHWVLDVTFREDESRTRERVLANNLSWLRRFAVTLLKRHPIKDSIRGKMIRCLMNTQFLDEVLTLPAV
ncbi:ISAs1 family transposase [Urbifossiella limnaea]|uniref:Transposase DDE domain protein n=1 Tax=Urbifossiella limnaea TaxID=2528023 RepID=A0A517XWK8_9BACT|nr:ISAs1 family transposase [Urbifossiella limnaea]QDU21878.1 Transposase DDE domain protein [Urbifossiella limnaea]